MHSINLFQEHATKVAPAKSTKPSCDGWMRLFRIEDIQPLKKQKKDPISYTVGKEQPHPTPTLPKRRTLLERELLIDEDVSVQIYRYRRSLIDIRVRLSIWKSTD
jgi:hypothetical protein